MPKLQETTVPKAVKTVRYDEGGAIRAMAYAEGWLMVKRPRQTPFVMKLNEWQGLRVKPALQ
jgi:hypothetical protein